MSILDNNILEETDYSKWGFPEKDNYIYISNTPCYWLIGNYYVIDNSYLWKHHDIYGVYIRWKDSNSNISIGVSKKTPEFINKNINENILYVDWLENFNGCIDYSNYAYREYKQDVAYQVVNYIKKNPDLIDKLLDKEKINLNQLLNL